jgi:hypothetical protein
MRFSQSSDLASLLAGTNPVGFAANPAVLGWATSGSNATGLATHYASRMPFLNLPDLYDFSQSASISDVGGAGWGAGISMHFMGIGFEHKVVEYALGIGNAFDTTGIFKQSLGVSWKALTSDGFRDTNGGKPSLGFLTDMGYLVSVGRHLKAGVDLENVGIGATGVRPMLYHMYSPGRRGTYVTYEADPDYTLAPLTLSLGAALVKSWQTETLRVLDASLAGSWTKRVTSGAEDESFTTMVLSIGLFRTLGFEAGFLRDPSSAELQGKLGWSLSLFHHVRITMDHVTSTGGMELFHGQKGFSLSLVQFLKWRPSDKAWWRVPPLEAP